MPRQSSFSIIAKSGKKSIKTRSWRVCHSPLYVVFAGKQAVFRPQPSQFVISTVSSHPVISTERSERRHVAKRRARNGNLFKLVLARPAGPVRGRGNVSSGKRSKLFLRLKLARPGRVCDFVWLCFFGLRRPIYFHNPYCHRSLHSFRSAANWLCFA